MEELLRFDVDSQTISARELHERLNIKTAYKDWFPRMCEYGFIEGTDFCSKMSESTGGRPAMDADISIEMAKEICMLQRSPEGKQVRQYLISLEKAWNTPEVVFARALKMANETIDNLKYENMTLIAENADLKPKAEFFDAVTDSKSAISMGDVAKILDMGVGRNKIFELLRKKKVLQNNNIPYQTFIDNGYFRVIEQKYDKGCGETCINLKTLVFQKGVDYIRRLVEVEGVS